MLQYGAWGLIGRMKEEAFPRRFVPWLVIAFSLCLPSILRAQAPTFSQAFVAGGGASRKMALSPEGDIYIASPRIFSPTPGVFFPTSLRKFSMDGVQKWGQDLDLPLGGVKPISVLPNWLTLTATGEPVVSGQYS